MAESRLLISKLYLAPEHLSPLRPTPSPSLFPLPIRDLRQKVNVAGTKPRFWYSLHRYPKKLKVLFVPVITDLKTFLALAAAECLGVEPLHRIVSYRFS